MPIPPHPLTFICTACNWKRTVIPLSDCLVEGRDWFSACPICGNGELDSRPATRAETMKERLANFVHPSPH
ncbi:hypothetical protein FEV13_14185 [Stutzerimonas degradans]|jgi:hypothetical protein|nr:hypothetical protein FEV13_14185 [Stutzerimonas degradans]